MNLPPSVGPVAFSLRPQAWYRFREVTFTFVDADGDAAAQYRIADAAGGGHFWTPSLGHVDDGATFTVAASALSTLWYRGGASSGFEHFTVAGYDGYTWGTASPGTVTVANTPPEVTGPEISLRPQQWYRFDGNAFAYTDADGDAAAQYRIVDAAGGGHFWTPSLGHVDDGATFTVEASALSTLWYRGGASSGPEHFTVAGSDGYTWGTASPGTVTVTNTTPEVMGPEISLRPQQWYRFDGNAFAYTDADGDAAAQYRIVDAAGGGHFWTPSLGHVDDGATFTVEASALSTLWYRGGASSGSEHFTVAGYDGYAWGAGSPGTVTVTNTAPEVTGPEISLRPQQWYRFDGDAFAYTDADGDAAAQYRIVDAAGGGHFWTPSLGHVDDGATFTVAASALSTLWYRGGASSGSEHFTVAGYDGYAWGAGSPGTVTVTNTAPEVTGPEISLRPQQWYRFDGGAFAYTDADGDAAAQYRIVDAAGGGHFWTPSLGHVDDGATFTVAASALSTLWYRGGASSGSEQFTVAGYDGYAWGTASPGTVTVENAAPVATGIGFEIRPTEWYAFGPNALSGADPDGDSIARFRIVDAPGGGHFWLPGTGNLVDGATFEIAPENVSDLWFRGGAAAGADGFVVAAYDGYEWGPEAAVVVSTVANSAPLAIVAPTGTMPATWYRFTDGQIAGYDEDGDPIGRFRIEDGLGGGQFWTPDHGIHADGATLELLAAGVGDLWYLAGADGFSDVFAITAFDGLEWGPRTVISFGDHVLSEGERDLLLDGFENAVGVGNDVDNYIGGNPADNVLLGGAGDDLLRGGFGNDWLDGEAGEHDVLLGDQGDDVLVYRHGATAIADGGWGVDTLVIGHVGAALRFAAGAVDAWSGAVDFGEVASSGAIVQAQAHYSSANSLFLGFDDALGAGQADPVAHTDEPASPVEAPVVLDGEFSRIEVIDLGGGGDNTLFLSEAQIENLPTDHYALRITGDPGDVVDAGEGWAWWEPGFTGGVTESVIYRQGHAYLEVDADVTLANAPPRPDGSTIVPGTFGVDALQVDLSLPETLSASIESGASLSLFGATLGGGGDIDGDGYDDLLIGAPYAPTSHVLVVFGAQIDTPGSHALDALEQAGAVRMSAPRPEDYLATGLALVGDVDGDGLQDFVVTGTDLSGAADIGDLIDEEGNFLPGAFESGAFGFTDLAHLVFGTRLGADLPVHSAAIEPPAGWTFSSDGSPFAAFGPDVAAIGDVNGDGLADFALGLQFVLPPGHVAPSPHTTFVVYGRDERPAAGDSDDPGAYGYFLSGPPAIFFGPTTISNGGDFNGDGYDDFLLGAPYDGVYGREDAGIAHLVLGEADGADRSYAPGLMTENIVRFIGPQDFDAAGYAVSVIGDLDGDGFDELAIGAPNANPDGVTSDYTGELHVVWGTETPQTLVELRSLGDRGFVVGGVTPGDRLGTAVAAAGDFNGDGYDDFVVSAPGAHTEGDTPAHGAFYLVFGNAERPEGRFDLDALGFNEVMEIYHGAPGGYLGHIVSGAGDVNGDGYDDLLIGDPARASAHVLFGRPHYAPGGEPENPQSLVDYEGTAAADHLIGTDADEILVGGEGDDVLDGGAGNDVLIGGAGDDRIVFDADDLLRVDGGNGDDTLVLHGGGRTLDLSAFGALTRHAVIEGIERIDITGTGENTLRLGSAEVLHASDTSNTLLVDGDAGDRVVFDLGAWTETATTSLGGTTYRSFVTGTVTLLVNAEVASGYVLEVTDDAGTGFEMLEGQTEFFTANILANDIDEAFREFVLVDRVNGYDASDRAPDDPYHVNDAGQVRLSFPEHAWDYLGPGDTGHFDFDYRVVDDFGHMQEGDVRVTVIGVDDPAEIAYFRSDSFTVAGASADVAARVYDVDSNLVRATVQVAAGFDPGVDYLRTSGAGELAVAYDALTGTLEISGSADAQTYSDLLATLRFEALGTEASLATRTLELTVEDAHGGTVSATTTVTMEPFAGNAALYTVGQAGAPLDGHRFRLDAGPVSYARALGDVDGDGFTELSFQATGTFASYVVSGADLVPGVFQTPAEQAAHVMLTPDTPFRSLSGAGDFNLDGYDDMMSGGYLSSGGYLVYGGPDLAGLPGSIVDLKQGDGSRGSWFHGPYSDQTAENFHRAGDVNGDGFADIHVTTRSGDSYVLFGRAAPLGATYQLDELSDGASGQGFQIVEQAGRDATVGRNGFVALGDVNGDGIDDFLAEAVSREKFIVFGKPTLGGHLLEVDFLDPALGGDGTHGFVLRRPEGAPSSSAFDAASAGDFNGDGFADIGIDFSITFGDPLDGDVHVAHVVFGGSDHGGALEWGTGAPLGEGVGISFILPSGTYYSDIDITGVGDVNGDGYDDVVLGGRSFDPDGINDAGRAYLVFGGADLDAVVALDSLTQARGLVLDGYRPGMNVGLTVHAGDLNGDGLDDFVLEGTSAGSEVRTAIYGQDFNGMIDFMGTGEADALDGTASDERLVAGRGDDTIDGGGGNDVIKGGAGDDVVVFDPHDTLRVDGGSGLDTLLFAGENLVLDFDNVHALRSFERIDLTGSGDNTVRLDIRDVLSLAGQAASFTDDQTVQVLIDGNAGDTVESQGQGWQQGADVTIGERAYASFTHVDIAAQLFVDPAVNFVIS